MVMVQSFNGAGDTNAPTVLNLICYWAIQIPLAWGLSGPLGLGTSRVLWAVPIAESLCAVLGLLCSAGGPGSRIDQSQHATTCGVLQVATEKSALPAICP